MKSIAIFLIAAGFIFGQSPNPGYGTVPPAGDPMAMRGLVERTQNDLRRAEGVERKQGKQVDRYEHAQRNLSDFDRRMTDGHFDKDKLNNVIEEVKDVVDHNTLQPNLQNALKNDLMDLKQMSMLHSEH